jgi:hypothetical protein
MNTFAFYYSFFSPEERIQFDLAMDSAGRRTGNYNLAEMLTSPARRYDSFSDFIDGALRWSDTPQGQGYWDNFPNKRSRIFPYDTKLRRYTGTDEISYIKFEDIVGVLAECYVNDLQGSFERFFIGLEDEINFVRVSRETISGNWFNVYAPKDDYVRVVYRDINWSSYNTSDKFRHEISEAMFSEFIPIPVEAEEYREGVNSYWKNLYSMNLSGYILGEDGKPVRCSSLPNLLPALVLNTSGVYSFKMIHIESDKYTEMNSYYNRLANGSIIRRVVETELVSNGDFSNCIVIDFNGDYIDDENSTLVHCGGAGEQYFDSNHLDSLQGGRVQVDGNTYYCNTVTVGNGEMYLNEDLANNDGYYFCSDCEDWYHEDEGCNGRYCNQDDEDNYQSENPRFEYHSCEHFDYSDGSEYKIGLEIEKECSEGCGHSHYSIREKFGWTKERDGSLDSEIGFELVSPAYDLFNDRIIEDAKKIEEAFPFIINGAISSSCGGHIHFSKRDTLGTDLLESVCGYLPALYSIYEHRINKTYCKVEEKEEMKRSDNKYQAVKVMRGRIEFRIFPAVKNLQVMEWRINLLRLIAKNPSSNPMQVANDLANTRTDLHKHFAKIFSRETIYRKAKKALEYAKKFDSNFYNVDMRANVRAIDSKISRLNKADAKKAEAKQLVLS